MWRNSFVKVKLNIFKNIDFLPVSKSISKSQQAYNVMTNNINHFKEIVDQAWVKHLMDHISLHAPTAHDIQILIKICLMPLALKTQNDSLAFVHELKQEMHADLKYVESLEKEIDDLESDKAEFSNMYDTILLECVSNDVMYLEAAFQKSTCFVRDLQGNDLLIGNHGSDLYTISLQETTSSTLICLMAKASPTQAWLWHQRLSHLNFDYINLLSKKDVVIGLPKLKYVKDQLCSSCEVSKAKQSSFKIKTVPSSKGRLNLLHMDLCSPMRVASINEKKDGGNLDKMKEKGDPCILVEYSTQSKGYRVYNKRTRLIVESIHLKFDEIKEMSKTYVANNTSVDTTVPSQQELDLLFGPLYDELFNAGLWYPKDSGFELTAFLDVDHTGCIDTRKSTSGGIQFLGQPKLDLWYPKDSPFDLEAFSDSDYAGASLDRKSTTKGCQFLGKRLILWQLMNLELKLVVAKVSTAEQKLLLNGCLDWNETVANDEIQSTLQSTLRALNSSELLPRKKVFANMKREGKDFSRKVTPLFGNMMVQALKDMGEGSEIPTNPYHTPIATHPTSSPPQKKQKSRRK
nr:Gag-Pol polyprotein [Tanacetum cinerariifolium]